MYRTSAPLVRRAEQPLLVREKISMIEITDGPDSTIICRPSGDLDYLSAGTFRHVITDLLRPQLKIVIDLRHAHDVDVVGLRALIGAARCVRSVGGTARIVNTNPRPRCLLRSVGAGQLIELPAAPSPSGAA
jgi:anti-anti-sigma factor